MALGLYFRPSFERCLRKLDPAHVKTVGLILEALQAYHSTIKQLRRPYSEAGVESHIRIVLKREKDKVIAVLAGNHDQIRQFLDSV